MSPGLKETNRGQLIAAEILEVLAAAMAEVTEETATVDGETAPKFPARFVASGKYSVWICWIVLPVQSLGIHLKAAVEILTSLPCLRARIYTDYSYFEEDLTKAAVEKVNLQIKGPAFHLVVKIIQIRIVLDFLVVGLPFVMFG